MDRAYEEKWRRLGFARIAGVDEAGRGPLAGPVVAAAVVLPADLEITGINDSKKLSPKVRSALFAEITRAAEYAVGVVPEDVIDEINIRQASFEAMRRAVAGLCPAPGAVLSDGFAIPGLAAPGEGIVKGDAKCLSIAAASIIAKVTRDRIMEEYDAVYPGYGFAAHKGYPTAAHYAAIRSMGPCPIHRKTFRLY
ncbi:MAG: ribonuclease HII [Clostridiales bacterium]|jgi:ribonuclease HII|nr:ribonuclease HII [Clostridiales bacterium]